MANRTPAFSVAFEVADGPEVRLPLTAMVSRLYARLLSLVSLGLIIGSSPGFAQELTPRAYWPAPKDTKLLILGYSHQSGDVVTDPSLPITGVDSSIDGGVVAYQQTFDLFGRTSNLQLQLPYVDGTTKGLVRNEAGRRDVSGFGDVSATLSLNLVGAPTMTREDFQEWRRDPQPVLAASMKLVAPTGDYEADKLINIGTNRWAIRPRLGYIRPLGEKWLMEVALGAWFFEDNDDFLGGTREQEPIGAFDMSLIRRIGPGFWVSLDLNYYLGGRTTIDGVEGADFQRNSRAGLTLVYPLKRRHAIKLAWSNGVVTESGGDFQTIALNYVYVIR